MFNKFNVTIYLKTLMLDIYNIMQFLKSMNHNNTEIIKLISQEL